MVARRKLDGVNLVPVGYVQYVAGTIDTAKNVDPLPGSFAVLLRCEAQNVRWRDDGVDPTAAKGNLMITTDAPYFYRGDLTKLKVIAATAGAILNCTFYA